MRVDDEMRELFRIESEEHLHHLDEGLLQLEKHPSDSELLAEVFREAHSMKGAAHMLGLSKIETVAHGLEELLGSVSKGEAFLSPEMIDLLCHDVDEVRRLVQEALTDEQEEAAVETLACLPQGVEATEASAASMAEGPAAVDRTETNVPTGPMVSPGAKSTQSARKSEGEEFRIGTIRIDTSRLDALMPHLDELTVSRIRIARHLAELEKINLLWEGICKKGGSRNASPLSASEEAQRLGKLLNALAATVRDDSGRLDAVAVSLEEGIRSLRLLPLSTIFNLFSRTVRDLARKEAKEVRLRIDGGDTASDKRIVEALKDPLMHLIRNAVDHGIEPPAEREGMGKPRCGTVLLKAYQTAASIVVEVSDDGRGLDCTMIGEGLVSRKICSQEELAAMSAGQIEEHIFDPAFSTSSRITEVSGRGVGLDVVRRSVELLQGEIQVKSLPGAGCTFRLQLPLSLTTLRVLIAMTSGFPFAVPLDCVEKTCFVAPGAVFPLDGHRATLINGRPVSVADLSALLGIEEESSNEGCSFRRGFPCVVINSDGRSLALLVNDLLDEQEIVLKPQGNILKRVRNIFGATILGTGEVCCVLNPRDLLSSAEKRENVVTGRKAGAVKERPKTILAADDSLTTRAQIKRILEGAGYEVVSAVDGLDALAKLGTRSFDGVVSDIMMPNMDGLTLTAKIRDNKKYRELPVILVSSLASEDDRKRGIAAGANAYITKPGFDQRLLLETVRRLV